MGKREGGETRRDRMEREREIEVRVVREKREGERRREEKR